LNYVKPYTGNTTTIGLGFVQKTLCV